MADIVVLAIIGLFAFISYKRGFVKTISKLVSWIIAVVVARAINPVVTEFIKKSFIALLFHTAGVLAVGYRLFRLNSVVQSKSACKIIRVKAVLY